MLATLALLGALWTAPPCETGFCSCAGPVDVRTALRTADAVFAGRVVSVRTVVMGRASVYGPRRMRRVTLRVDRAWKGVERRTVVVFTGMGGGDCGYPFRGGESYLVFAYERDDGALATGICGRTAAVSSAAPDLRDLGSPSRRWPD